LSDRETHERETPESAEVSLSLSPESAKGSNGLQSTVQRYKEKPAKRLRAIERHKREKPPPNQLNFLSAFILRSSPESAKGSNGLQRYKGESSTKEAHSDDSNIKTPPSPESTELSLSLRPNGPQGFHHRSPKYRSKVRQQQKRLIAVAT
jgi:hypothetical protein